MNDSVPSENLRSLFLSECQFIDVRSELEFAKGAFPTSFNAPILNTQERHQVGICYKKQGQEKAVELGHQLVNGAVKEQRLATWCEFIRHHSDTYLYCWRGGLRSNLAQEWINMAGFDVPLIAGGYKALRRVLLEELDFSARSSPVIIGGRTGTAKTLLINELATGVDLEGFAHHRGSSFGRHVQEPPCQVDFENRLAINLLKKREASPSFPIFLEDESRMIGPVSVPLTLWNAMANADVAVVEMPLSFRVERVLQEYVVEMAAEHLAVDAERGFERFRDYLLGSLERIRKRLGLERYRQLHQSMSSAIDQQFKTGDVSAHEGWITALLEQYYDPMYDYQLKKKQERVVFVGDYRAVLEWAEHKCAL